MVEVRNLSESDLDNAKYLTDSEDWKTRRKRKNLKRELKAKNK